MTGASPRTEWLRGCLALDSKGFVLTGHDLDRLTLQRAASGRCRVRRRFWRPACPGYSRLAIYASGNVKRVASAVGEGSIAIHLVHRALAEL